MQLTLWTYEGPPHVGAMRIATAMRGVHYVLHAPQGDTYADLLFTMIERRDRRPPVTYTTFQARDLGADTATLFKSAVQEAYERFQPQAMLVGASCTAELIQDDPGGLARALGLPIPVVALELPSYQRKENWGASETFYQLVRACAGPSAPPPGSTRAPRAEGRRPRCNLLGPTALGFRHRDDVREIATLLARMGVDVHVIAPLDATPGGPRAAGRGGLQHRAVPGDRRRRRRLAAARVRPADGAHGADRRRRDARVHARGRRSSPASTRRPSPTTTARARPGTRARSIRPTSRTSACSSSATPPMPIAAARIASEELGFTVVGLGTYSREFAREVREAAQRYGVEALITDDYLEVEARVAELQPELVLGTQMERHIAKRLGIPCAVISAPVHVQDFPARYSPQMGFEGANVLFDTWVHPLMMGLEEHLLDDVPRRFRVPRRCRALAPGRRRHRAARGAGARGGGRGRRADAGAGGRRQRARGRGRCRAGWATEAEAELKKIPFFVRGKARRNTERFARERGVSLITVETLYDAKAHFGR